MNNARFFGGMGIGLAAGLAVGIAVPRRKNGTALGNAMRSVGDTVDRVCGLCGMAKA